MFRHSRLAAGVDVAEEVVDLVLGDGVLAHAEEGALRVHVADDGFDERVLALVLQRVQRREVVQRRLQTCKKQTN